MKDDMEYVVVLVETLYECGEPTDGGVPDVAEVSFHRDIRDVALILKGAFSQDLDWAVFVREGAKTRRVAVTYPYDPERITVQE